MAPTAASRSRPAGSAIPWSRAIRMDCSSPQASSSPRTLLSGPPTCDTDTHRTETALFIFTSACRISPVRLAPLINPVDFDLAFACEQPLRQEDFDVFRFALDRIDRNICKPADQPHGSALRPAVSASECCGRRARTETFQYGKTVQSNRYDCGPARLRTLE